MTDNEAAAMVEKVISSGGDAGSSPDEPSPPTKKPDDDDDPPPIAEEEEDTSKPPDADDAATDKTTGDDAAKTSTSDIAKDDDDSTDDDDDDKDNDAPSFDASPDDLLLRAMTHKEDGNTHFKSGDYTSATRSYRKGTNLLKKLNEANSGDEQVKTLLISLQTNLSMVCYRQKKHRMSRDVASRALEIDPLNVKALYRRAVASRAMGDADAAKDDLKAALKVDPKNLSAKKELMAIKKTLEEQKKKEKAGLQKAFSKKGSSLLYSDKEEEEKRKLKEKKERKILEEAAKQKRKQEWEDESVKMMYRDPPETPISFDDWEKQRKQKEEEKEKARKKAKKEEERKRKDQQHKTAAANSNNNQNNNDSDDDELTEKELAMLRGYKKTSDGRTTSYFNNEQTERTKKLIGDFTPKRMETPSSPSPTASISSGGGGSAWNQSGTTWEEKDTTDWCKKTLEQCLLDTTTAYYSTSSNDSTYVAVVKKVSDLIGDASVALVGGKKRYIYDFHASVEYEVLDDAQACIASGLLKLPELNSATTAEEDELEVEVLGWKKAPVGGEGVLRHVVQDAVECRTMLVQDVRKSVLRFVEKFNADF